MDSFAHVAITRQIGGVPKSAALVRGPLIMTEGRLRWDPLHLRGSREGHVLLVGRERWPRDVASAVRRFLHARRSCAIHERGPRAAHEIHHINVLLLPAGQLRKTSDETLLSENEGKLGCMGGSDEVREA